MSNPSFPAGWSAERVKRLIDHYDGQSEDDQVAEDEAASENALEGLAVITVPEELLPAIRHLLADHRNGLPSVKTRPD